MKTIIGIAILVIVLAIFASEFIRATRVVIAYIKGDECTINRLTYSYEYCETLARKYYECSPELFAEYYKEVRDYDSHALPYDALEFAEWEYHILNFK